MKISMYSRLIVGMIVVLYIVVSVIFLVLKRFVVSDMFM